ncbi:class I SAM-dependent methyltransferase [Sorangium sp. So ce1097]|uniref:class I SAM-dependent methyltransferase n=1 Tax=Sorangium sp. So ce1097 TaxID=3133330 RepID=UPI003F62A101
MGQEFDRGQENVADVTYTRNVLNVYDLVLKLISNTFWGCSASRVVRFYDEHVSGNHLDVGVGTGYFLDHCRFPGAKVRLVLMDANQDPIGYASKRLRRYAPTGLQANVMTPIPFDGEKFDSIGVNHVVHCLPGTMREKGVAFQNLKALMKSGAVLFGATVLGRGVNHNFLGAKWLEYSNQKGVLDNLRDSAEDLKTVLEEHFATSSVQVIGRTALFTART